MARQLADALARWTPSIEASVMKEGVALEAALARAMGTERIAPSHRLAVLSAVGALFRWRGWLRPWWDDESADARLLLASLLDQPAVTPLAGRWAQKLGWDLRQYPWLGDAPDWTAKALGFRRYPHEINVNVDPWSLFPDWLREQMLVFPGEETPKRRAVEQLWWLQRAAEPWYRLVKGDATKTWQRLKQAGLTPQIHPSFPDAARLGQAKTSRRWLEDQDLALVQEPGLELAAVAMADPDAGERWWITAPGSGALPAHLATQMGGKGLVIVSAGGPSELTKAASIGRLAGVTNLSTKVSDAGRIPGKPGTFDGVIVRPQSSRLGRWATQPERRWGVDGRRLAELGKGQLEAVEAAAKALKPGGTLVYAVESIAKVETVEVAREFTARHPEFAPGKAPECSGATREMNQLFLWPSADEGVGGFLATWTKRP